MLAAGYWDRCVGVAPARHLAGPTCLGLGTGTGYHRELVAAFLYFLTALIQKSAAGQD